MTVEAAASRLIEAMDEVDAVKTAELMCYDDLVRANRRLREAVRCLRKELAL